MKPLDESLGSSPTLVGGQGGGAAEVLSAGAVLGNYRIARFLGAGGMGAVYVAEHIHLKTRHALKTIRPEFARRPGFEERFLREARLTAHLKHPHIVPCTDAGVANGIPYLVMDYIEGPAGEPLNLRQLLDQRRERGELLDEDEAAAVGLEICRALDYAHSYRDAEIPNGIIHRDLKPGNILLDAETKLYITDFGLARLVGEKFEEGVVQAHALSRSLGDDPTLRGGKTSTSSDAVGTFDYMSPEQREGRVADVRSDVYAIGAILYELLTGRKVVGALAPPSRVRPGLNPAWDDIIIARCLAYEPGDRYATAGELARAIEGTASQALEKPIPPVSSRVCETGSLAANPRKADKKTKLIVALAVGITSLLAVAVLVKWLSGSNQKPTPPEQTTAKAATTNLPVAVVTPPPGPVTPPAQPAPQPQPVSTATIAHAQSVQPTTDAHQAGDTMAVDLGGGVKMDFAWIPAGKFLMGSPENEKGRAAEEGPQHEVSISSGFWMGKTEVTQKQYEQLMGRNPSSFKGAADLPVEQVAWEKAKAFCEKLQPQLSPALRDTIARLPTEAEWEYACRAGTTGRFAGELGKMAWFDDNSKENGRGTTHPVAQAQPNAWGLYDMHGNVSEWCWDKRRVYAANAVIDPIGAGPSRVSRGGCWYDSEKFCRSANRQGLTDGSNRVGFRVLLAGPSGSSVVSTTTQPATPKVIVEHKAGEQRTVDLGGGVKLDLVWVPAGSFDMGSNAGGTESPLHRVTISKGFWMGKYEVTQAQWEKIAGNNPSNFKGATLPVEQVSWDDCQGFVELLNQKLGSAGLKARLPTEAEWEYACRAGTTGDSAGAIVNMAWYDANSNRQTHPVGQKRPNAFGLYDMHGNVNEWCQDWFDNYEEKPVTDPTGPAIGGRRVIRGGCWGEDSWTCRSAYRFSYWVDTRGDSLGLRVVVDEKPGGASSSILQKTSEDAAASHSRESTPPPPQLRYLAAMNVGGNFTYQLNDGLSRTTRFVKLGDFFNGYRVLKHEPKAAEGDVLVLEKDGVQLRLVKGVRR